MKKIMYNLLLLLVLSGMVAGKTYSYSLNGKVYYAGTNLPAANASVQLKTEVSQGGTITANDGSFAFKWTAEDWDPKGTKMTLTASKGMVYKGSKSWYCAGYSEVKDVSMFFSGIVNPNLSTMIAPANFVMPGPQPPVTVVAFLDEPGPEVRVLHFQVVLEWNPEQLNLIGIFESPESKFNVMWTPPPEPQPARAIVQGHAKGGEAVPIRPQQEWPAESFFDVFFDVILPPEDTSAIATVTVVPEETFLVDPQGMPPHEQHPYQAQSDYLLGEPEPCKTTFLIDSMDDWIAALEGERPGPAIRPTPMTAWDAYMAYWRDPMNETEGQPYPDTRFVPAGPVEQGLGGALYVWPEINGAEDPGLVMAWGETLPETGNYASAWRWDFGLDPDLSNSTIQVTVTPPAPPAGGTSHITAVSFAIVDVNGLVRSWWWSVPGAIPLGVATTVTINTAMTGPGAATPMATGYLNTAGFDITQAQFFDVDENFQYIFGQQTVPPPGQMQFMAWNYWHNLIVTKNTKAYKGTYVKWSQPPVVLDESSDMPHIWGWDERSLYHLQYRPVLADDWQCTDDRPVTDIHWWGSFIGWTQPYLPPVLPRAFHIGIWTDVPDPDPSNPQTFSHPGQMIWEHVCDKWVWNFAGYDIDPRCDYPDLPCEKFEACFQFNQLLSENEWFYQSPDPEGKGRVYWISIAAIYDLDVQEIRYPWGWKTRPHFFNDDAVRIQTVYDPTGLGVWPPKLGSIWGSGVPVALPPYPNPQAVSWDLAFELTTNKPAYADNPIPGDIGREGGVLIPDGKVNLHDLMIMASNWLVGAP